MADDYTPSDEQVRTSFVEGMSEDCYAMSWHEPFAEGYDRWLAAHDARVRRDAAREALDGLAEHIDWTASQFLGVRVGSQKAQDVRTYRDTNYPTPEEAP